jgi:hypothetical protein
MLSLSVSAQETAIFDTSKVDINTKLIGRSASYNKEKTYGDLDFIIDDQETIKKVITELTLGEEKENVIQGPNFIICIVQNYDEKKSWIVNPGRNSVMYNGHSYEFDVTKLKGLAKKYPFDYKAERVSFKTELEYEQYLEKQRANKGFLFDYAPPFKYEGSFEIVFPRNDKFSSPKAVSDYLDPLIQKIAPKKEYSIIYKIELGKPSDQKTYRPIILGSKKIFDKLQLNNLKKENWKETVEEGVFFYRIK